MLTGKKTYITAAIMALATFARTMGWVDANQYEVIVGLAASLGLAALRAGMAKSQE